MINWKKFAEIYNNPEDYPNLSDVAVKLEISHQTVRNRAAILRSLSKSDPSYPTLISRTAKTKKAKRTVLQHANSRAESLDLEIERLITGTMYPVINASAIVIKAHTKRIYDRGIGDYVERETTPRTLITDTLRVSPISDFKGKKFLFSGAQNDAEIHVDFWNNLNVYAEHIGAEIIIGPWTYETQWWSENNPISRSYDERISDHLCFGQLKIGENFLFCGEMNTLPTASRPISDLTTYSRGKWAVFPHPRLQLKSVPSTDPNKQAHQVMTTGSVTKPTVIPRKAGVKSIFHHVIGATLVEFDNDGDIFCRQINADDFGNFQDLSTKVENGKVIRGQKVRSIVVGDIHVRKLDPKNSEAVFGLNTKTWKKSKGSMINTLCPKEVFIHDVFDNEARNHHHIGDNAYSYQMAYREKDGVLDEIVDVANFLNNISKTSSKVVVVESNHDIGLLRYISEGRYRNDGKNIKMGLVLETAYMNHIERMSDQLEAHEKTETFSMLETAVRYCNPVLSNVEWVHDGQSYLSDDIECGNHGFRGANGSKGTVTGFASIGRKMSIGDKHSPEILDGVYVAGVLNLKMGYNKGPSGWAVTCIVQYDNGKRSLITLQNGKWRA